VAVDDVSFAIAPGEVVGLLGHNGAGKTTIMKMLTGYLEPSAGGVIVNGVSLADDRLAVQRQMGYLPENLPLYPELTVIDYLAYAAELRGVDAAEAVPRAMAATELASKAFAPINTLSRGYKQRVGVAQAILHAPRYLILDEPTNGLDPAQTQQMRALIRRLASEATVILSTHIMQEVDAVCDRALILRGGKVVLDERLDALQRTDRIAIRTSAAGNIADVLAGVEGIRAVLPVAAGRWEAQIVGAVDPITPRVAERLLAAGLPVYQLSPVHRDLETVFREVNEGDAGAASEVVHAA
jgi:ABC-2 type transport system ATP-binding protein